MSDKAKRDAVLDRYSGNGWDYPDHEAMAWRIVALEAAMERVRALHNTYPDYKARWCRHCKTQEWPCPTFRALEETP